jgi:pimeloyl-ACP methyl ester carboxylesterase
MADLLLLHGALGAASTVKPLQQALALHYRAHTLNFRGHGGAPMPDEPFSIPLFAEDVLRYMDQHQLRQVNIFGYSMGGYVALYLALHHPDRVKRIFTLATKFAWSPETAAHETKMLQPDKVQEKVPAFAASLTQRHQPNDWKDVMNCTADMMRQLGNNPALNQETLSQITIPVRIAVGDRDAMVTLQETVWAYEHLPKSSLLVLPDTPHPLEKADIQRLKYEIGQFLTPMAV